MNSNSHSHGGVERLELQRSRNSHILGPCSRNSNSYTCTYSYSHTCTSWETPPGVQEGSPTR